MDHATAGIARLTRARSAIGTCRYGLGLGGLKPTARDPGRWAIRKGRPGNYCDCSGFVAWTIGRSRRPSAAFPLWLSTDSIHHDATQHNRLFVTVHPDALLPGDIAVYPDWRDAAGAHHDGHTAIVADPLRRTVVDCGSSSGGITERVLSVFWARDDAIFCRPR